MYISGLTSGLHGLTLPSSRIFIFSHFNPFHPIILIELKLIHSEGNLRIELKNTKLRTTLNNGYLGSRNDEERSEMRYVMRIAEFSESSNL